MKILTPKFVIRVSAFDDNCDLRTVGYIGSTKDKGTAIRLETGKLSEYRIKLKGEILDTSYIPTFESYQSCLATLSTFSDMFFDSYQWKIEELK